MTPAEGQTLFNYGVWIVLTGYGIGFTIGLFVKLINRS